MHRIFIIISFLILSHFAFSQDIITLKNGDKLKVKVLQITDYKVTYTKPEEPSGKIYNIDLSKVFIIIFEQKNIKYKRNQKTIADTSSM